MAVEVVVALVVLSGMEAVILVVDVAWILQYLGQIELPWDGV
jgi:hypothetical protein